MSLALVSSTKALHARLPCASLAPPACPAVPRGPKTRKAGSAVLKSTGRSSRTPGEASATDRSLVRRPRRREMKSILGLVSGASCRIDVDFKDDQGRPYKKTATVKVKNESEDLPLYTNKDDIFGEVGSGVEGS